MRIGRGSLLLATAGLALGARLLANRRANRAAVAGVADDLRPWISAMPPAFLTGFDGAPPRRRRVADTALARVMPRGLGRPRTIPGPQGAPDVPVFVYDPPGRDRPSGAVLWIHGGGMIVGGPWMSHGVCTGLARHLGVLVVSVDYRLAPEHPFPAGPEDCFAALAWLHEQSADLGVDPTRVAVGGESAGGGLAAMVAQMAHDRGLPLACQALVYPMLDDRTALVADHGGRGRLVWTPAHNAAAWGWFLDHPVTEEEGRPYAAAARRDDLSGLAPAWIGVGDLDLFHDEDVAYAQRLRDAGVEVDLVVVPGMPHAADALSWVPSMREFRDSMRAALARALA